MTVWDVQTGKAEWSSPDASVGAIAFSADSTILAGLGRKVLPDPREESTMPKVLARYLSLWDPATGELVQSYLLPPTFPARAIAFLPDGKTVAAISYKGITFYHTETRQMEQGIEWDSHWNGRAFAFSRDGKLVVRTDYEWANLVDVQTGEVEGTLTTRFPDTWWHPTFSSDLKQMACACQGAPIIIEMPWPPQISPPEKPAHGTAVAAAKKAPEVAVGEGPESATRGQSRAAALEVRTWTDSTGTFSVEAELLHFAGGVVHLRKLDGTIITLPIERLSAEDQQWVRKRFSRSWQRERNNRSWQRERDNPR
jgi:hypothetical protein